MRNLAKEIEPEYGSGFSCRQLYFCLQFYQTFPIANTLYSQLNWGQYRLLLRIGNQDKCYDWAIAQRDQGNCIISGFHSRMEKDVFHYLLAGTQPVIMALARGVKEKIDTDLKVAVNEVLNYEKGN